MKLWMPIYALGAGFIYTGIKLLFNPRHASIETHRFVAFWLIVSYVFLIAFDTVEKKRSISLLVQTLLGTLVGVAVTVLVEGKAEHLAVAAVIGTLLGWTSDLWAKLIRWA